MYRTADQIAEEFIAEGKRRGITERGIVICIATGLVESNLTVYANSKVPASLALPHDAVGSDGYSVGPLQQQVVMGANGWWWGDAATCMDPTKSSALFYVRLAKLDYNNTAHTPGSYAQAIQQSAYPDRYDQRMSDAQAIYDRLSGGTPVTEAPRPDFNEYANWSTNCQDRAGTKIDLILLHTQEGGGGDNAADDLAKFLRSTEGGANPVSYHDCISQASDGGVTVVDVVDTDQASWSVGNSNNRAINYCFAGSYSSWTRVQWMAQSKAIDTAAYLAVQDCQKYGIPIRVLWPYSAPGGIADHRYCTQYLKDGNNHTDVGDNFPWDYFAQRVAYWANPVAPQPPVVSPPPAAPQPQPVVVGPAADQLTMRFNCLGGQTLVEAVAEIRDKITGSNDRNKTGVVVQ